MDGARLVGAVTAAPYSVALTNVVAGTHAYTAKATDDNGAATTSAVVNVVVDTPPTVSITSPANGALFNAPAAITINANATDADGTVAKVDFFEGATLLGTATAAPYSVSLANVAAGSHSYTARATDNNGIATTSAAVSVTVDAAPAVSLTAPANNAVFAAPASITLTASATDAVGTIAKVDFYQGATLIGTSAAAPYTFAWTNVAAGASIARVDFYQGATLITSVTAAPYSFTWTGVPAGSYSLTAVAVNDAGQATTSTAVAITVKAGGVQMYFIHPDHLNTPRAVSDANANVVWKWDQTEPFGDSVPNSNLSGAGTFEQNLRFPGQIFDRETGISYNFYRDYDPIVGRYVESDPIGLQGGLNTYAYGKGNPLTRIDAAGLCARSDPCSSTKFCWRRYGSFYKTCKDGLPEWQVCLVFSTCYPYFRRTEKSLCPESIGPPRA